MLKQKWPKDVFGHELCDLLVLDEASQMNLPEAVMAALPLKPDAPLIVVGDHRQMPPIVKHDWDARGPPHLPAVPGLREPVRHPAVAEPADDPVRRELPAACGDGRVPAAGGLPARRHRLPLARRRTCCRPIRSRTTWSPPCCDPDYPLVVVVHDEADSQVRNPFEQALIEPILRALADPARYGLDAEDGLGIVVPHRAQRAALQQAFPELCVIDPASGLPARSAIDTVERFQGGERTVILVSATESDRAYLLASSDVPARPPPADGGREPGEAEDDPGRLPEHLLAVQPGRGDVRQLAAVEEPAAADLHDAAVGGGAGWQAGGGKMRKAENHADA